MKLLKLKIENKDGFRSLQQGFEINFHTLDDTEAMGQFRPFCFRSEERRVGKEC